MRPQSRVYVDMVGDLFHPGHLELLRAARTFGDHLVVGVLSDESAAAYKRRPVMTLEERVAMVEACRYVDEVVPDAPLVLTTAFLDEQDIAVVVHGDDLDSEAASTVYGAAVETGRLRLVPPTSALSTTGIIARVTRRSDEWESRARRPSTVLPVIREAAHDDFAAIRRLYAQLHPDDPVPQDGAD